MNKSTEEEEKKEELPSAPESNPLQKSGEEPIDKPVDGPNVTGEEPVDTGELQNEEALVKSPVNNVVPGEKDTITTEEEVGKEKTEQEEQEAGEPEQEQEEQEEEKQ